MTGLAVAIAAAAPARAEQSQSHEQELQQQLDEMKAREAASQARIEALEKKLQVIESTLGAGPVSDTTQATIRGRGAPTGVSARRIGDTVIAVQNGEQGGGESPDQTPAAPGSAAATSGTEQAAASTEPDRKTPAPSAVVEAVTKNEQGYFGDRFSLEFGTTYSHFDDAQINLSGFLALDSIFLGLINIEQTTGDVFVADTTLRYGVTPRLQLDVNIPYLYRHNNYVSGGAGGAASGLQEADVHDSGVGDVNFGVAYRLVAETVNRPDIVLNARGKIPTGREPFGNSVINVQGSEGNLLIPRHLSTGSGLWSASAGVSVLKTLDPLVVFGSLTYFKNFEGHFDDIDERDGLQPGRVRVGDAIQWGAGFAFALNERSSLTTSFTQRIVERTELKRDIGTRFVPVVSSQANVGIIDFGGTFALTEKLALIAQIGVGMTRDAPNMIVSVRLPFRF